VDIYAHDHRQVLFDEQPGRALEYMSYTEGRILFTV